MAKITNPTPTLPWNRPRRITRMRELRVARGLSQVDLAVLVGVAPNYMSILERAPSRMTPEVAGRVAKILGCAADEIRS